MATVSLLTFEKGMSLDFIRLARMVNTESFSHDMRNDAAAILRTRAKKDMRGPSWLARCFDDKRAVRKAMMYGMEQQKGMAG